MASYLFHPADSLVVFDFETTGLSPAQGDRAIEIGAVRLREGVVVDRFQHLMNPGFRVSGFIESYTGISNQMLRHAPPGEEVMSAFFDFLGEDNLVAHNASFDRRFLEAEWERIGHSLRGGITCSMLVARRLYPQAPNHQLGTLVSYCGLKAEGVFHRALADSEMTARLWYRMTEDIRLQYRIPGLSFKQMEQLARKPRHAVGAFLERCRDEAC